MHTRWCRGALVGLLCLVGGLPGLGRPAGAPSAAWAQTPWMFLRADASAGQDRGGRPIVYGWVYNSYGLPAIRVRLLVESLDASGEQIGQMQQEVQGEIPGNGRTYYEMRVPSPGVAYRVRIVYGDWKGNGSAGA